MIAGAFGGLDFGPFPVFCTVGSSAFAAGGGDGAAAVAAPEDVVAVYVVVLWAVVVDLSGVVAEAVGELAAQGGSVRRFPYCRPR